MIKISAAAAALAVIVMSSQAFAADTPEQIVKRHMDATLKGDPAAMAADYADDAVVLQPGTVVAGKASIVALFTRVFGPGAANKPNITPTRIWSEGDVGLVTWEANGGTLKGTDSFLIRNGKVAVQAVFIGGAPPAR